MMQTEPDNEAFLVELINRMMHDLRAPVRHCRMFAEIIDEETDVQSRGETLDQAIEGIGDATTKHERISDAIVSLLRSCEGSYERVSIDLSDLVQLAWGGAIAGDENSGSCSIESEMPEIERDSRRLRIAMEHVFENSIRHRDREQKVRVAVSAAKIDRQVALTIRDFGTGVPGISLDQLTDPFNVIPSSADPPGMGLGLTIAKRIIKKHGGQLRIASHPDGGLTVTMTLPCPKRTNPSVG